MRGIVVRGEEIRAARLRQGLTQAVLARLSGLDAKTVRKAEQGKRIDLLPLSRLAQALQTDVHLLIVPDDAEAGLQIRRRATILKWIVAFDSFDGVALMKCFDDDAVMRIPGDPNIPFSGLCRGKTEILKAHEQAWTTRKQEPTRLEELTFSVSDAAITVQGAKGIYLPNGELVYFQCVQIFTFVGELIHEYEVQFDTLDFARKLNYLK